MSTRRGLFSGVAALAAAPAVVGATVPSASPPHLDALLLRLGEKLAASWAIENEAWATAEGEDNDDGPNTIEAGARTAATSKIIGQIEQARALTLDGLHVKMRAILWCRAGEPVALESLDWSDEPSTDMRVLASLLADLSAMGRTSA